MPSPKKKVRKKRPAPLSPATEALLRKDEYAFQRVCSEAYSHEPGLDRCSIYGTRGQSQHGTDVLAYCRDGLQIELVQCKRYAEFGVAELERAVRDFLDHWDRWKKESVRRFVVVTSADISDRHLQDAILEARRDFRTRNVIFDVWGDSELCRKLKPHRAAVQEIYGGDDADRICGPVPETAAWRATDRLIRDHVGNALVELEEERTTQLEGLRELNREGSVVEARDRALAIRTGAAWAGYGSEIRARFLRFEAAVRLSLGEAIDLPLALVAQAKEIHPQLDYQVADSLLAAHRSGCAHALAILKAPASLDAWNMRWALMLEVGRAAEVRAEFEQRIGMTANSETRRILALAALLSGDLATAEVEVARARALAPKHRGVRIAGAIIDFRSCLVDATDVGVILAWPTPVRWAFVRRDPASLDRLRRAAAEFSALRASATPRDAEIMMNWELGSLACDPTRNAEAEAYAQERLKEVPGRFRVAAWAVERDYSFDSVAVAAGIGEAIKQTPSIDLDAHFALCAVLLAGRKAREAEAALDEAEEAFKAQGHHDAWKVQKARFCARAGQSVKKLVESIKDPRLQAQARVLAFKIGRGKPAEFRRLAEKFAQEFKAGGSPAMLFQACEAYNRAGAPKFIADHARQLVEKIGTDAAVRLALHGSFAAGQPDLCLELLREKQGMLQGGVLSPELRRLHAACLEKIGKLNEAIQAAESLYRERPEPKTFSELFRILVLAGDIPRAAILARDLVAMPRADVTLLLQTANFTRLHNVKLAQELWRRAAGMPLKSTNLLLGVVSTAFALGTEHEHPELQQQLFKRAKANRGPIQRKTLDEVREIFRERQEYQAKLSASYDRSEAPIHMIASPAGTALVQVYHGMLEDNRATKDLTRAPSLLARYGGRSPPKKIGDRVLFTDITSLILAADLGILDKVEEHLGPLYIAPETLQSLVQQVSTCGPHQPSQHAWRLEVQGLIADGEISVVDERTAPDLPSTHPLYSLGRDWHVAWQTARDNASIVAVDFPMLSEDGKQSVAIPPEHAAEVADLRRLLASAVTCGAMPAEKLAEHTGPVGAFRAYPTPLLDEPAVPAGTGILLSSVPLEIISNQGALKSLAKAFRVRILRSDLDRIVAWEAAHARRVALADWTQSLLDRINAGIAKGRYLVLPQTFDDAERGDVGLDVKGLGNLLRTVGANPAASLWCDDRMVNRHPLAGSMPTIDVLEVVGMLQKKKALTEAEADEKLTHLRRSNVRYVPVTEAEILRYLNLAAIEDGKIVETVALATLRRYYAACLLERGRLIGPQKNGTRDIQEWNFVMLLRQAVDNAFRLLWVQDLPTEALEAQAEWIWKSVYVDLVGLRCAVGNQVSVKELHELSAFHIGSLFSLGITLPFRPKTKGSKSPRDHYFDWVNTWLLGPCEHANPGFIESVGLIVARDIERTCREALKLPLGDTRKAQDLVMAKLYMDLPEVLREHVDLSADVLAELRIKVHGPTITVDGVHFDYAAFVAAQAAAFADGTANVVGREGGAEWRFDRALATVPTLNMTLGDGRVKVWSDPELAALLPDVQSRIDALEKVAFWFDCDRAARVAALQAVCLLERPIDRILRLHAWRDNSPAAGYRDLSRALRSGEPVDGDFIRVRDWQRLMRHLRLPAPSGDPNADLDAAAESLLGDEGLERALQTFMAMPRRMPRCLEQAWTKLSDDDAASLWTRLSRLPKSVLGDLQLVRLGILRPHLDRSVVEAALEGLFDRQAGEVLIDSFFAVLAWVERDFNRWAKRGELPPWQRLILIWYHASRLHGAFRAHGGKLEDVEKWFRENTSTWHHGVMAHDAAYASDLSHPSLVSAGSLLVNGLANLLVDRPESEVDALGVTRKWQALAAKDSTYTGRTLVDICRLTELASNSLDAIFANTTQAMRDRLLGANWDDGLRLATGVVPLAEVIGMVAKDPLSAEGWSALLASVRELPVPESDRPAMIAALAAADYEQLIGQNWKLARAALTFAASQARGLGAEFRCQFEERLLKLAAGTVRASLPHPHDQEFDLCVLQCLLAVSTVPDDQAKTAANYFEKIGILISIRPTIASIVNNPVLHWLAGLPFEQQSGLRELLSKVRAHV